ncbi:MAG: isoprenyl transferase [Armatimonadota bacterium]
MKLSKRALELKKQIDFDRLPVHISIIMDGNRRWAGKKHIPAVMGHKAGVEAFRKMLEASREIGIKYITVYAFSSENWSRSEKEVSALMRFFKFYANRERENMRKNGIRLMIVGDMEGLPKNVREEFAKSMEYTKECKDLVLNLAVNYGSRVEIIDVVKNIAKDVKNGGIDVKDIDEKLISDYLYTKGSPDPDLMIRTSNEFRISNFLLWQSAYTEFYFTDVLWPDFNPEELFKAVIEYQKRDRRFGGGAHAS